MVAVYPNEAVFNVNNFAVTGSVQYNNTGTLTEFILPTAIRHAGQLLPYVDGILQDFQNYELSNFNGITYSNVAFNVPMYASNLTLKTISIPSRFFIDETSISTALVTYTNATPVIIRSNTYVVDGIRSTFALPVTANSTNKSTILAVRNGVHQDADKYTFPSATLNIYGIDFLDVPKAEETVEIRIFDAGVQKYGRKNSIADRKVDKGYSYTREPEVAISKFIAGYEKRRLITRRMKRRWNLSYTNITGIEKEAIEQFYLARSGTWESFIFELSHLNDLGTATVVFDSPPTVTSVLAGSDTDLNQNFYTVNIVFREVDD